MGIQLGAAVIFVRDLRRSVQFYCELLDLRVTDQSTTAALLSPDSGPQVVLRQAGPNAPHALGGVGIQYLAWLTPGKADLDRRADLLRQRSAYRETRTHDDTVVVEGRDPDDLVVLLIWPGESQEALHSLPARIYAW